LSDKCQFVGQRYTSLPSGEGKDPPPKTSTEDFDKRLAGALKQGRFPMQYYNRFGAGKNRRCGLERTGADIGTEAVFPVVYCGRIDYSSNRANHKTSIGSDGYPNL